MLYPEVTTEEWLRKYPLVPEEIECDCCHVKFQTTVPVIMKGYAGLEIPSHSCDKKYLAATFVPIDQNEIQYWSQLYS